ncbi:Trehalase, partial [Gryllus bimaculatus]
MALWWIWSVLAIVAAAVAAAGADALESEYICDSPIYCHGSLLHEIQISSLREDSKTFVDMKLKISVNETLRNFETLMARLENNPTSSELQSFVDDHFELGEELEGVELPDWVEAPPLLTRISDPHLRNWSFWLNARWKSLARRVPESVKLQGDRTSLLYLPNAFIVPGGRFKEMYYWDTHWIVRGLLLCAMNETVRGILENFFYILRTYGIIPNGTRVYYQRRSNPPLLTSMVHDYIRVTRDLAFLQENVEWLEREFEFWMKNRTVAVVKDGVNYTLVREDYDIGSKFPADKEEEFYYNIKAACESGWDFSSNLSNISVQNIVPVDLNAYVYRNAVLLSDFHKQLGNREKADRYATIANEWKATVTALLWNNEEGSWFDYDILNNKQRTFFYASNLAPLWTKCYDEQKSPEIAEKVVRYLERRVLSHSMAGIPQSLQYSGEQWDFPNAFAPSQHIIIEGLDLTGHPRAQKLAFDLASTWVASNFLTYQEERHMYEKYDARCFARPGSGGEYTVQEGFGWTNGVIIQLLQTYGDNLTATVS